MNIFFSVFLFFSGFLFFAMGCSPSNSPTNNTNNVNNTNNLNNTNNTNNTNNVNNTNNTNSTNNLNNTNNTNSTNNLNNTNNTNNPVPSVLILSPFDNETVDNPVTFTIAATLVAMVDIKVDDWALSDPFDPSVQNSLTYNFSGVGFSRHVLLTGYDNNGVEVATHEIDITPVEPDHGTYLSQLYNTYYYFAMESDYSGPDDTTLYDSSCNAIAQVPADFSDDVCIEGSGKLSDGTVITYSSTCSCGRPCPTGGTVCYATVDGNLYPWGMGNSGNAIEPLVSWATDPSVIASGTVIYAPAWDGVYIPLVDGIGGFTHDGCFRADDVGGWIQNDHYDFFAGTHDMWQALEGILPTNSYSDVYVNPPSCAYLQ